MKKISSVATLTFFVIVAIIFFIISFIKFNSIAHSNDNKIILNNLTNNETKAAFSYHVLTMDAPKKEIYSMDIADTSFYKLSNNKEPYKLIMYRIACNWYKVFFNDHLIGSYGNTSDTNSIIWNGIADFSIDPQTVRQNNTITIELYGQYEIGNFSFLPFITDMNEASRTISYMKFMTGFYTAAIGMLLLCFLLLLLLSTMIEQKNLAYLCYAIATCLAALYICDSVTIQYLSISLLTFKKLIYTAVYCSIATFSLAIHFHFNRRSPLIFALILYFLNLLLIIISSDTIIIRKLAVICNIAILLNAICWICITITEKNKHEEATILCIAASFFLFTSLSDIIFMFAKTDSAFNFLCTNIFGALFFSIAIAVMIFNEYVKMHLNILTEKEQSRRLYDKSIKDPMTGVFNKGYLTATMDNLRDMYTVIMIDADKFKNINDTYGHDCGDEVIHRIAQICCENVRNNDIVCREGGDEFVIILPLCNENVGGNVGRAILDAFRKPFTLSNGTPLSMSLSIGVYCNRTGSVDPITALRYADKAQYAVKQNGRNNVMCYSQAVRDGLIPLEMI